jgi:hypothetical protein
MLRKTMISLLPLAILINATTAVAEEQPVSISEAQDKEFKEAIRRGELIYVYDQAAWHSTDTMLEDIKDPAKAGVRGWIVVASNSESRFKAIYYGKDEKGPFEIYSAIWDGTKIVDRFVGDKSAKTRLSAEANRLVVALDVVREVEWKMCNRLSPNAVVLPGLSSEMPDSVYILTPQPNADSYLLGGHTRFDVKDGKIAKQRQFANSCLTMTKKGEKGGEEVINFFATHLLDEVPTEIHVFTMLTSRVPITVLTTQNNLMWSLGREAGEVVFDVERLPPSAPAN